MVGGEREEMEQQTDRIKRGERLEATERTGEKIKGKSDASMEGIKTRIEPLEEARGEPRIGQVTLSSDAEHISKQKISEVKCVYFKMG